MSSHVRVLALLVSMLICCGGLAVLCGLVGHLHGAHTVAFMAAEVGMFLTCFVTRAKRYIFFTCGKMFSLSIFQCLLVTVRTGHVIIR